MLRKTDIYALQVDAGRRLTWITPCKPQAQLRVETGHALSLLRSSRTGWPSILRASSFIIHLKIQPV
jgi:hypothetical protein